MIAASEIDADGAQLVLVERLDRFERHGRCRAPLAAHDYLQIARAFHAILIDDIPVVADEERDVARRMIQLVDSVYDHRVKLVASAAAEPAAIYTVANGEEVFAFRRTASRLIEMRSLAYLAPAHGSSSPEAGPAASGDPPLAPQHQSG
ncbi:MAG: AFG1/ZapE family ATPase [Xanthobacteraceae bacterium]